MKENKVSTRKEHSDDEYPVEDVFPSVAPTKSVFANAKLPVAAGTPPIESAFTAQSNAAQQSASPFKSVFATSAAPQLVSQFKGTHVVPEGSIPTAPAALVSPKQMKTEKLPSQKHPVMSAFANAKLPVAAGTPPIESAFTAQSNAAQQSASPFKSVFATSAAPQLVSQFKGADAFKESQKTAQPATNTECHPFANIDRSSASTTSSILDCTGAGNKTSSLAQKNLPVSLLATVVSSATSHITEQTSPVRPESGVWRCQVCNKVKELKGAHLNNKKSVRSDCWPCAKKTTFILFASGGSTASPTAAVSSAPSATPPPTSVFKTPSVFSDAKTAEALLKVPAESTSTGPAQAPTSSPAAGKPAAGDESGVWRCQVCNKVKELKGAHLNNKKSVRSDCWPCAKKTTFILFASGGSTASPTAAVSSAPSATPPPTSVFKTPSVFSDARAAEALLKVPAESASLDSSGLRVSSTTEQVVFNDPSQAVKTGDSSASNAFVMGGVFGGGSASCSAPGEMKGAVSAEATSTKNFPAPCFSANTLSGIHGSTGFTSPFSKIPSHTANIVSKPELEVSRSMKDVISPRTDKSNVAEPAVTKPFGVTSALTTKPAANNGTSSTPPPPLALERTPAIPIAGDFGSLSLTPALTGATTNIIDVAKESKVSATEAHRGPHSEGDKTAACQCCGRGCEKLLETTLKENMSAVIRSEVKKMKSELMEELRCLLVTNITLETEEEEEDIFGISTEAYNGAPCHLRSAFRKFR